VSSLDKVIRLAQEPAPTPDAADIVRAASEKLERLALLLAKKAEEDDDEDDDPDDDGDDDSNAKGDTDHDFWSKKGKKKKALPGKKDDKVKASRSLVLDTMVALSQLTGGEHISLSVLTAAERRKPSAHTMSGTTDFPIPDESHLSAAVREYHAGNLAGHSKEEVAAHIRTAAKRLGKSVDLSTSPEATVMALARAQQEVAMEHAPMTGEHDHPHRIVNVHSHKHQHNNDSRHACGDSGYGY
jgi:hypothetical protein